MIVLPPSFPYGGMENPRLTFLTPTLLAGDRSLVDVVAHELAHSWTGNLVTNANMDALLAERGLHRLGRAADPGGAPRRGGRGPAAGRSARRRSTESRALRAPTPRSPGCATTSTGIDPDDVFSSVPYEKGARFLVAPRADGRARALRRASCATTSTRFRFTSITTEEFLDVPRGASSPASPTQVDAEALALRAGHARRTPRSSARRGSRR